MRLFKKHRSLETVQFSFVLMCVCIVVLISSCLLPVNELNAEPVKGVFLSVKDKEGNVMQYETSRGKLKANVYLEKEKQITSMSGDSMKIVKGIYYISPENAILLGKELLVYPGARVNFPAKITLVHEKGSGNWLATDGRLFVSNDRLYLLEEQTINVIGGGNNPIIIAGQQFIDTTVFIKDGKPSKSRSNIIKDGKPSKFGSNIIKDGKPSKLSLKLDDIIYVVIHVTVALVVIGFLLLLIYLSKLGRKAKEREKRAAVKSAKTLKSKKSYTSDKIEDFKFRPRSITVISWYLIITSGIGIISLIIALFFGQTANSKNLTSYLMQSVSVVMGLVIGISMLKGRNWGRLLFVIQFGFAFVIFLAMAISSKLSLLYVLFHIPGLIIIFFLFRPRANEYFGGIFRKSKETIQNMSKVVESTKTSSKTEVQPGKQSYVSDRQKNSDQESFDPSHAFQPIDRVGSDPWTRDRFDDFIYGQGLSSGMKAIMVSEDGLRIEWLEGELNPGRWVWFEFVLGRTAESLYIDVLDACAFELLIDKPFKGDFLALANQVGTATDLTDAQKHAIHDYFTTGEGESRWGPQWGRRSPRVRAVMGAKEESTSVVKEQETDASRIEQGAAKESSKIKLAESTSHKSANKKVFLPECFLCKKPMEEVEDWGAGLQGGDVICPHCKEKHHYRISRGEMTLSRAVIPVGYNGEVEKKYFHTDNESGKGGKMDNILKTIEIEAGSIEKAKQQLNAQLPEGLIIISEEIISRGKKKRIKESADTIEDAFASALAKVPLEAENVNKEVLEKPDRKLFQIEAENDNEARTKISEKYEGRYNHVIGSVSLSIKGKKGFFGIGRTLNTYDVSVIRKAIVRVKYNETVKLRAKVGTYVDKIKKYVSEMNDEELIKVLRHGREEEISSLLTVLKDHSGEIDDPTALAVIDLLASDNTKYQEISLDIIVSRDWIALMAMKIAFELRERALYQDEMVMPLNQVIQKIINTPVLGKAQASLALACINAYPLDVKSKELFDERFKYFTRDERAIIKSSV